MKRRSLACLLGCRLCADKTRAYQRLGHNEPLALLVARRLRIERPVNERFVHCFADFDARSCRPGGSNLIFFDSNQPNIRLRQQRLTLVTKAL